MKGKRPLNYQWRTNLTDSIDGRDGYVAALLDRGYLKAKFSKKNGKPLHVLIQLSEADEWAKQQFDDIELDYRLSEEVELQHKDIRPTRDQETRRWTWILIIHNPIDVLRILRPCSRYMRKRDLAEKMIKACEMLIASGNSPNSVVE